MSLLSLPLSLSLTLSIALCGSYVYFERSRKQFLLTDEIYMFPAYRYYLWVTKAPCVAL